MRYLSLLILLFGIQAATAQQDSFKPGDTSEVNHYLYLFYGGPKRLVSREEMTDEKQAYAEKIVALSKQLDYKYGLAEGYNCLGIVYTARKHGKKAALSNYEASAAVARQANDEEQLGTAMYNIGLLYYNHKKLKPAIDHLLEAEQLLAKLDDTLILGNVYYMLGNLYTIRHDQQLALKYYLTAVGFFKLHNKLTSVGGVYLQLGWQMARQSKYKEAKAYTEKALDIAKQTGDECAIKNALECQDHINKRKSK